MKTFYDTMLNYSRFLVNYLYFLMEDSFASEVIWFFYDTETIFSVAFQMKPVFVDIVSRQLLQKYIFQMPIQQSILLAYHLEYQ